MTLELATPKAPPVCPTCGAPPDERCHPNCIARSKPVLRMPPQDLQRLIAAFADMNVVVDVADRWEGPRTITYHVTPGRGITLRSVRLAVEDVALRVGARSCVARVDDGRLLVEIGRNDPVIPRMVDLKQPTNPEEFILGVDSVGNVVATRLGDMVHSILAGVSGGGKSTALQVLVAGISRDPTARIVICDPKASGDFPGGPVADGNPLCVYSEDMAIAGAIGIVLDEVKRRAPQGGFRGKDYWGGWFGKGPVVLVVDELQRVRDRHILRDLHDILATGRSAGVHCVLATQHPSAEIIGNEMRVNCPTRLCLQVASASDSRVALGEGGAESLLGKGDALLKLGGRLTRIQVPSIT